MTENFVAVAGVRPGGIRSEDKMTRRDPNFVDVHVGSRIRMRRQLIGMSQEKLGELLGITFQQVQKYENGKNRISAGRLYEVAKALGLSRKDLYRQALAMKEAP